MKVVHRIWTHDLARGLRRRPDTQVIGITFGPVSLLWDRNFKADEKRRKVGR